MHPLLAYMLYVIHVFGSLAPATLAGFPFGLMFAYYGDCFGNYLFRNTKRKDHRKIIRHSRSGAVIMVFDGYLWFLIFAAPTRPPRIIF